jgi:uncharacterized Zn finger protein
LSDTNTVIGLVARFSLRRQATTIAFAEGVRLARLGAVTLDELSPGEVRGQVVDGESLSVRIFAAGGRLLGECPCSPDGHAPCRHQVALAHVVWIKGRRGIA